MVGIVEVSPRDGLQNERAIVPTQSKIKLIDLAISAGIRRIEVASFVNPARVPQMADAEAVVRGINDRTTGSMIGLALNQRGFERAVTAGCDEVTFVVLASDTFNRRNNGAPIEKTLSEWRNVSRDAKSAAIKSSVIIGASFGCPFEGEVSLRQVLDLVEAVLEDAPDELAFADTIGCGVPTQVTAILKGAVALAPQIPLRCHFHNTRNTGLANAVAAVEAGVAWLDASIGGIGGCPFAPNATGNIATEDLVYLLSRMGVPTGLDLDKLIASGRWLAHLLGKEAQGGLVRAGVFPPVAGSRKA